MAEERDPSEHEQPALDRTAPMEQVPAQPSPAEPGPAETAPMDAVADPATEAGAVAGAAAAGAAANPRWSARAEVRPGGAGAVRDASPSDWEYPGDDPYAGRSWFTPIVVGVVSLVLLATLVIGLVLIYRATHKSNGPQPAGGTSSAVPSAPASTRRSTAPTSAAATQTAVAKVTVPADVVGKSEATARAELEALGLVVQVRQQQNGSADPGTVLRTEPGVNSQVDPGGVVVLVVATAPPPPPPPTSNPGPSSS